MKIEHWDTTRDGPLTEAALRDKLEERGYVVNRYVYPPGTVFRTHTHDREKIDAVLSGQFRITTVKGSIVLGPGDYIYVPPGAPHSAEVVGDEPVVSLDGIVYGG